MGRNDDTMSRNRAEFSLIITQPSMPVSCPFHTCVPAGVIGCEFAAILANFGQTKVHLVNERRARLLPSEDEDISAFITEMYRVCTRAGWYAALGWQFPH